MSVPLSVFQKIYLFYMLWTSVASDTFHCQLPAVHIQYNYFINNVKQQGRMQKILTWGLGEGTEGGDPLP